MTGMDGSASSPREVASSAAELDSDAGRVARAAADLGVPVPRTFRLSGVGEDGGHLAVLGGTARDFQHGIAIMARLDGKPVEECLAEMARPAPEGPDPEWAPPTDWTDTEAMLAWLAERERHPEWPRVYNGVGDWAQLVAAFLGGQIGIKAIAEAVTSIHNERARAALVRYVVDRTVEQGGKIDPVALIRAINSTPAIESTKTNDPEAEEPTDRAG
jgi:hypothetical protein